MPYWFENPTLKALAPLALSTSIKGLTTIFKTPKIYVGSNVFPEGPVIGPSTMDAPGSPMRPEAGLRGLRRVQRTQRPQRGRAIPPIRRIHGGDLGQGPSPKPP